MNKWGEESIYREKRPGANTREVLTKGLQPIEKQPQRVPRSTDQPL